MKRILTCVAVCLFILAPLTISAQETAEMEDLSEMVAPPGTVVSISPTACIPYNQSYYDDFIFHAGPTEAYFEYDMFAFMVGFEVPVYLPHGVTVTKMVVYFTDNSGGDDDSMDVSLYRHQMATGTLSNMAGVSSYPFANSPDRRTMRDRSIKYPLINNQWFSYHLIVRFWQGREEVKFHGAKIFYELMP